MSIRNKLSQSLSAGALIAMCSFGASANLLVNPSFEDPSLGGAAEAFGAGTGWSSYGDWGGPFTIADFTDAQLDPHEGVQMLKIFGPSGVYQDFAINAGDTVDGNFWAFNDGADAMSPGTTSGIDVSFFDAADNFISVLNGDTMVDVATNVWMNLAVSGAAPAGVSYARVVLFNNPGTAGGAPKFDDAYFDITPSAVPVPAAVWLFGSGLVGLVGVARRRKG